MPFLILFLFQVCWMQMICGDGDADNISRWKTGYYFSGIPTFAHLHHVQCLIEQEEPFDLAVVGVPFDTSVTSRPGIRENICYLRF